MKRLLLKNGQRVIVRKANENDAIAIGNLVDSIASEKYYVVTERSREDWDVAIREIQNRSSLIIVAQITLEIVGFATLVRGKSEKNEHVGFLGIGIQKEFRRISIGTAVMNFVMKWAEQQKGIEKISLTVFSTNEAAIDSYRKFGFEIEGIIKRQYKIEGEYVDDLVMGKWLA